MFLLQKIEELMVNYSDARHTVGEFVLNEKAAIGDYTIAQIAQKTYTSKATVVRFAKTLGYEGWKEFKKDYLAELNYRASHSDDVDVNIPFKKGDSMDVLVNNLMNLLIESVRDTVDLLDYAMVEKAVEYLKNARHVIIFGISPNDYLGQLFKRKLLTIGKYADVVQFSEIGLMSKFMTKQDCAIVISYSGNTRFSEPISSLKTLIGKKIPIIGITSGGDNFIRNNVTCVLTISSRERLYSKISNFATENSINFILNLIFSRYFMDDYERNLIYKIENAKDLEVQRAATLKELKD
ncbi:MAG: MurR/RpiR family transcriptional regulator [Erysipelotrichaceae bacterium]|nr:MurR/RpiR family transcriptional regulator [Erysipelotrichaceae bacterium]MDD3809176.1 MurR/RpiR family transcriptional regulator [Erysipelotrichaceae bacterium]